MSINLAQAQETCERIKRNVEAFRAAPAKIEPLLAAMSSLQWLRGLYPYNKAAIGPCVGELRELGAAVAECARQAREALTEEYLKATSAIRAWEHRREVCRDALMELAKTDRVALFSSASGAVEVKPYRALTLPRAGTPQRDELAALIRETGRWEALTMPNGGRILKALDDNVLSPDQAARMTALCRIEDTVRLSGRFGTTPREQGDGHV
ncbi:MAG: hypothetical protein ACE15C_03330 [Phycisphaerae bacterium]